MSHKTLFKSCPVVLANALCRRARRTHIMNDPRTHGAGRRADTDERPHGGAGKQADTWQMDGQIDRKMNGHTNRQIEVFLED